MINYYSKKLEENQAYYEYVRSDVLEFISSQNIIKGSETVLEIGCGNGATGQKIMQDYGIAEYHGVELMPGPADGARGILTSVINDDFERMIQANEFHDLNNKKYEIVILLDVLEHMKDPWEVLEVLKSMMAEGGLIIVSIPNAGNWYLVKKLLNDSFEYEERGILDRTHLRFFTWHTIRSMMKSTGFEIVSSTNVNDLFVPKLKWFNRLTFGLFRKQFIKQYLFIASLKNGGNGVNK